MDIHLKKSNQESLLEAGSLIVNEENPSPEVSSLYTRVRSLQRLKVYFCHCFIVLTGNSIFKSSELFLKMLILCGNRKNLLSFID